MRSALAFVVLAVAGGIAILLQPAPGPLTGTARVSDGDSFWLDEQRVRLVGLDAPELDQTCTRGGGEDWPCGEAARDRLATLLGDDDLSCVGEGRDRYDRVLARCTTGAGDPAAILVAEGLALDDGRYGAEQASARADASGVWQGGFVPPRQWRSEGPEISAAETFRNWLLRLIGAT